MLYDVAPPMADQARDTCELPGVAACKTGCVGMTAATDSVAAIRSALPSVLPPRFPVFR